MKIFLLYLICLLLAVQSINGRSLKANGRFEIIDGDCANTNALQRVYEKKVSKIGVPLITHRVDVTWYGDETIYCLLVPSELDQSQGSLVYLNNGGVGHNFVELQLVSKKGGGLNYTVKVFAKRK